MQDLPISMGDERDVFERQERRNPVIVVLTRSNGRKRGRTLSTRRRGRRRCELGQTDTQSGPRSFTPHRSIQQSLLRRKTLSVSSIGDSACEDSSLRRGLRIPGWLSSQTGELLLYIGNDAVALPESGTDRDGGCVFQGERLHQVHQREPV